MRHAVSPTHIWNPKPRARWPRHLSAFAAACCRGQPHTLTRHARDVQHIRMVHCNLLSICGVQDVQV